MPWAMPNKRAAAPSSTAADKGSCNRKLAYDAEQSCDAEHGCNAEHGFDADLNTAVAAKQDTMSSTTATPSKCDAAAPSTAARSDGCDAKHSCDSENSAAAMLGIEAAEHAARPNKSGSANASTTRR